MELLPISFLAGILTILAPCILPLLPVIIGGSLTEQDKKRPLIITASLALSIIVFTLLLKATTAFIDIPQDFWTWFSAAIVFLFGISLLFPSLWPKLSLWISKISGQKESLEHKSQKILFKFHNKKGFWSAVILGAALGPIFASCSPTYFLILGTVLPASFGIGLANLFSYAIGLALVMFGVAYLGQKFTKTLNVAANPNGWFKRGLGILFIIVAVGISQGYDKKLSTYLLDNGLFDITAVEQKILDKQNPSEFEKDVFIPKKNNSVLNTNKPAPDIVGLENWLNTAGYESLTELRGKVVLIDFWTYSCINCIRTLPYLQEWHEKYADKGFVLIGVHAPEFSFERRIENLENAVNKYGITYPVVQDNNFETWRNYKNRYWPAKYLIDKEGNVRYYHFGEGDYKETEMAITELLNTPIMESNIEEKTSSLKGYFITHETYLGTERRANFAGINAEKLKKNEWSISESWSEDDEKILSSNLPVDLSMSFNAAEANLVMDGNAKVEIIIDGEYYKTVTVDGPRLYNIYKEKDYKNHTVKLNFSGEHVEVFAWTFG